MQLKSALAHFHNTGGKRIVQTKKSCGNAVAFLQTWTSDLRLLPDRPEFDSWTGSPVAEVQICSW
jgi:hypothetical protein